MNPVELRTDRLLLSVPELRDVDTITALCQDPEVQRWTTVPSPYARQHAVGFVDSAQRGWRDGTPLIWALREPRSGQVLGAVDLHDVDEGEAEIGYWLGRPHRGSALMAEAAGAVCDFGFGQLALQRITWHAFVPNRASAAVARAVGFRFEGTARLGAPQRGARHDEWQGGLLAGDPRHDPGDWPAETLRSAEAAE